MKQMILVLSSLFLLATAQAQDPEWSSPEVAQMYRQAKDYLSKGAVEKVITLLQQAILLEPDMMVLHRDLAYAQNISGKYEEAYKTIDPVISNGQGDEQSYQIAGVALVGSKNNKKARSVLEAGVARYPHSGILHHELGVYFADVNDMPAALTTWLKGIEHDPGYHMNYFEAAKYYASTDYPVWTIIYGEQFVNMERYTARSQETRKLIIGAYTKLYKNIASFTSEQLKELAQGKKFEDALIYTFSQLSPVVTDGFTTENLIMLRTRFLMSWFSSYAGRYPFSLFTYQDKLVRLGYFDAYNQWLFGRAENEQSFEGWTQFHPQALPAFEQWAQENKLQPSSADFYNRQQVTASSPRQKKTRKR